MRRLLLILLLLGLLFGLRLGANQLLGSITARIFADGTGCVVELSRPRLYFFPLRGAIHDVRVYHPSEGKERGFTADRITVDLAFLPLFSKLVLLHELRLEGARVHSIGEETGFIRTMEFLFADRDKPTPKTKPWHNLLTGDWSAWVPRVVITTAEGRTDQLVIGAGDFALVADQVDFLSRDPINLATTPVELAARASNARIMLGDAPARPLGSVDGRLLMGGGQALIRSLVITGAEEERGSRIKAIGRFFTKGEGNYALRVSGALHDGYLNRLAFGVDDTSDARAEARISAAITGPLVSPRVEGQVEGAVERFGGIALRPGCAIGQIRTSFAVDEQGLQIRDLHADTFLREGALSLQFDDALSFSSNASLQAGAADDYLIRCFLGEHPEGRAVEDLVGASALKIEAQGSATPPAIKGSADGRLRIGDAAGSVVAAEFAATDQALELTFEEKPRNEVHAGRIDTSLRYEFSNDRLEIKRLRFASFPVRRLLVRAAPFLEEALVLQLEAALIPESRLDADFTGTVGLEPFAAQGAGQAVLRDIAPAGIAVELLELPVKVADTVVDIPQLKVQSEAGPLQAALRIDTAGPISGTVVAEGLQLGAVGPIRESLPGFTARAAVQGTVAGTLEEPVWSVDALVIHSELASLPGNPRSTLKLKGERQTVSGSLMLLDERARVEVRQSKETHGFLELQAYAQRFPLNVLLELAGQPPLGDPPSDLTLEARYEGPISDPLMGEGELMISSLQFKADDVRIFNNGPLRASVANGRFECRSCTLQVNQEQLQVTGYVDRNEGWNTRIAGTVALGDYLPRLDFLEQIEGDVQLDLRVTGPVDAPSPHGRLELADASVSLPLGPSVIGAEDIDIEAVFSGERLEISRLSGRIGDGKLRGGGGVEHLTNAALREFRLAIQFSDVLMEPVENLTLDFGGELAVEQRGVDPFVVRGDFVINEALYESSVRLNDLLNSLKNTLLGRTIVSAAEKGSGPGDTPPQLRIRIRGDDGLIVETNVAEAELRTELFVFGTTSAPLVRGNIRVIDGTFGFEGNKFDILRGVFRFPRGSQRIDPQLDIVGETTVQSATVPEQQIRLIVSGTLSNPKVNFTSETGLGEQQIVGLLTGLGTGSGLKLLEERRTERTFRELISPTSGASLQDRLAGLTGFTDVELKTGVSPITGEFVPVVEAKRPLTSELNLTIESQLAAEQFSSVGTEYELTPYLSLLAGWRNHSVTSANTDSSGSYEVGIRYRNTFPGLLFWRTSSPLKEGK